MGRYLNTLFALVLSLFLSNIAVAQKISAPYLVLGATSSAALTADDQAVSIGSSGYIYLSSDNATAANRTFTLSGGSAGQFLLLIWNDTDAGQLADTGNVKLSAAWEPDGDDTLLLFYDGTNWLEITRAAN